MDGRFDVLLFGEALIDELPGGRVPGGAPFNVACHLGALGARPLLVTRVGRDAEGRRLERTMQRRGLDRRGVQRDPSRRTARVTVRLGEDGPRFEIPRDQAFDGIDAGAAIAALDGAAPRIVYFGTLAQRSATSRTALEALLQASPGTRFLDANLRAPWYDRDVVHRSLQLADIVKINEEECTEIASLLEMAPAGRGFRSTITSRYDLSSVVVTRGPRGAVQQNKSGVEIATPPPRRATRVVDAVGAGDAFSAVLLLALLRGWAPETAVLRADAFARGVCRLRGAVPRRSSFYTRFLAEWKNGETA
jgi:fructokinase